MQKLFKTTLSVLLCLILLLSAASCELVDKVKEFFAYDSINYNPDHPPGYTGGFSWPGKRYRSTEIHWVETYEEAEFIIDRLRENGTKLYRSMISSYENDVVDAKYCFLVFMDKNDEKPGKNQAWYDTKRSSVAVDYYGFLDKISIDELEYSYYERYRVIEMDAFRNDDYAFDDTQPNLVIDCDGKGEVTYKEDCLCLIKLEENGQQVATMTYRGIKHYEDLPENFHDEFLKSLVVIGGN